MRDAKVEQSVEQGGQERVDRVDRPVRADAQRNLDALLEAVFLRFRPVAHTIPLDKRNNVPYIYGMQFRLKPR